MPYYFLDVGVVESLKDSIIFDMTRLQIQIRAKQEALDALSLPHTESETKQIDTDDVNIDENKLMDGLPHLKPEQKAPEPKPPEKHNRWAGVQFLRKEDILIPKFEFDKDKKQFFQNIFFVEESDGRVAILYGDSTYCTTKDRVLGLPYPFPAKYFDPKRNWNTSAEQAIKKYRMYLAGVGDPDRAFKPMLKTNTRTDYDGGKVEGALE